MPKPTLSCFLDITSKIFFLVGEFCNTITKSHGSNSVMSPSKIELHRLGSQNRKNDCLLDLA